VYAEWLALDFGKQYLGMIKGEMTDIVQRCGRLEKYVGRIRSKRHKVLKGVLREQLESTGLLHDVLVLLLWELTAHCYRLLAVSKFERAIGRQMFAGQKLLAPIVQSAQLVVRLFFFVVVFVFFVVSLPSLRRLSLF
jgi:hypothetical protein